MAYNFANKTVLITGGNSGIGLACVKKFSSLGATVIATGRRALSSLNQLTAEETALLHRIDYQQNDVSEPNDITRLFAYLAATYPRLDVAVNNAGITGPVAQLLQDTTLDEYQQVMDTNARSVLLCMQQELKRMLPQASGSIVNTSSVAGLKGSRVSALYSMSKFAVNGLTRTAALQYAKSGVRINAVCPSIVDTPILPPGITPQLGANIPMGRIAEAYEIADAIAWLASDEASFITGATMPLDGGSTV